MGITDLRSMLQSIIDLSVCFSSLCTAVQLQHPTDYSRATVTNDLIHSEEQQIHSIFITRMQYTVAKVLSLPRKCARSEEGAVYVRPGEQLWNSVPVRVSTTYTSVI